MKNISGNQATNHDFSQWSNYFQACMDIRHSGWFFDASVPGRTEEPSVLVGTARVAQRSAALLRRAAATGSGLSALAPGQAPSLVVLGGGGGPAPGCPRRRSSESSFKPPPPHAHTHTHAHARQCDCQHVKIALGGFIRGGAQPDGPRAG